jgi:type IV secretory pathway TrbD component
MRGHRTGHEAVAGEGGERIAIHQSLIRPILFAGVEPPVAIIEGAIVLALLVVVGIHLATVGLAALYLTVVHTAMAAATRADPQISAVYLRSLGARDHYPPHARLSAPPSPVRPARPG